MYVQRQLSSQLEKLSHLYPILSVSGPRQSGKTTLVRQVFSDYAYVNLERLDNRLAAEEDPRRFLERYEDRGLIIDEAQKVPALFSYLQVLVDERGTMGQFILTGSQNFLLLDQVSQSLAGRVAPHTLLPFSQQELAPSSCSNLEESLFTGGYPVLYDRGVAPTDYFPAYIQTYVERDVRSLRNIGDLSAFQRFLRVCAGRVGQLLDLSGLGNDLGINYKTARAWISVLEASYIAFLLYPHHENFSKRLIKSPKLYLYDTGLLCSILGLESADQLATHYLRGAIFENWVIAETIKRHVNAGRRPDLYFWRDNTGNEIDLLFDRGGRRQVVEIKAGTTLGTDQFKGLRYYRKLATALPLEQDYYLIYAGEERQERAHGLVLGWRDTGESAWDFGEDRSG